MRTRTLLVVPLLTRCVWVNEDAGRLDQDGDHVPVSVDCNDEDPAIATLDGWTGDITCGAVVDGDIEAGDDRLRIANCIHPVQTDDLVVLGQNEHVYRFLSEVSTDVAATLWTSQFLLGALDRDTGDVALLANRGSACALDSCVVGLPLAPDWYRTVDPPGAPPPWDPVVRFHAQAGEAWYVVVSGGRGGSDPVTYALEIACPE